MRSLGIEAPPSITALEALLKDAIRSFAWEAAEKHASKLAEEASKTTTSTISGREEQLRARLDRLRSLQFSVPEAADAAPKKAHEALAKGDAAAANSALLEAYAVLDALEKERSRIVRERLRSLIAWAGQEARREAIESRLSSVLSALEKGEFREANALLDQELPRVLPEAATKLRKLESETQELLKVAQELNVDASGLARILELAPQARPLDMESAGDGILVSRKEVEGSLRPRALERVKSLEGFAHTLKEEGADLGEGMATLEEVRAQIPNAPLEDLHTLLAKATQCVEGPVMSVVAAYVDEVRPRVVEARQLGRNAGPALEEVNKAREAYRNKEFTKALDSARKALELASELVADMEAGHEEIGEFKQLLSRLALAGLTSPVYDDVVKRAEEALRKSELGTMRSLLQEGLRTVGRECQPFFRSQLEVQRTLLGKAEEHGWSTSELPEKLKQARQEFQSGRFAETAEALSAFKAALRSTLAPHISHRLEELGKAVEEVPDLDSVSSIRRMMAETDIALKIREDVEQALESLTQTEKELAVTFAARASSLVEELEDERRGLAQMGADTDRLEKEIAQTHQIFDMGDFLKASRASRELKARLLQQQLLRAEEEVSKAKFALVELAKMGLEPPALKTGLVDATDRLRSGRYPGAFERASQVRTEATRIKETAQRVRREIASLAELVAGLRKSGVAQDELQPVLPRAKLASEAFQGMDFDRALALTQDLKDALRAIGSKRETALLASQLEALFVGARLIGVLDPAWETQLGQVKASLAKGDPAAAQATLNDLAPRALDATRKALDQQLQSLENDLRTARSAGLDTASVEASLQDARRRLGEPVPSGVAELIDKARREFFSGRSFREQAEKALAAAREAVHQGDMVRADTADLKPRLEELERRFAGGELTGTLELAQRLQRDAEEKVKAQVSRTLASFQAMINHAKIEGAITAVAENLLVQARNLLGAGKAMEALQLATRSETELERVELQHSLATNALSTLRSKFEEAQRRGVKAPEVEREIARADTLRAKGEYSQVLERTLEAGDLLLRATEQHRKASDSLESATRLLASLSGLELDLKGPQEQLEKARQLQAEGKDAESQGTASAAAETARVALEAVLNASFEKARTQLQALTKLDAGAAEPFASRLTSAQEAQRNRDWKGTFELLRTTQKDVERALQGALLKEQDALRALWSGSPAATPEEEEARSGIVRELDDAREKGDPVRFDKALQAARSEAQGKRRQSLEKHVAELEATLLLGTRLGVDTTPVMEALGEVKMNMQGGPVEPLAAQLTKTEQMLSALLGTRLADRTTEVAGEADYAREGMGIDVSAVDAMLRKVEKLQGSGDMIGAAKQLVEAEGELSRRKELQWQIANAEFLIGQLSNAKVDVTAVREILSQAVRARDTDHARALELSQKALDELKRLQAGGAPGTGSASA